MNPTCIWDGENQVLNNCLANFSLYNIVSLWVIVSCNLQHCDTWLMAKCTKTVCTLLISHNSTITHKAQRTKWDPIIFNYFTGLFGGFECSLSSKWRLQVGQKMWCGTNNLYINYWLCGPKHWLWGHRATVIAACQGPPLQLYLCWNNHMGPVIWKHINSKLCLPRVLLCFPHHQETSL